jgi:hypothetical protein
MFEAKIKRLPLAFAAACCTLFVLASVGADAAWAGDCSMASFVFNLGTTNICNSATALTGSAGNTLSVGSTLAGGIALSGNATAATGAGWGVYGVTQSSGAGAYGVVGILFNSSPGSPSSGVFGQSQSSSASANGPGVYGLHSATSGGAPGVLGETNSTASNGVGVLGQSFGPGKGVVGAAANGAAGTGVGVFGSSGPGPNPGYGVTGSSQSTAADAAGVWGSINSSAANAAGVRGTNSGNCCGMGVAGFHAGQGIGVYGEAQNGFAVSGFSPNNWSGYFQGSVNVVGTLYKSSGAFRIDNPVDPAHSYLQHSFVESPDMKNIYDGTVTTNGKGFATVKLPAYFQALNKDFRYQLTLLGKGAWGAQAIVWEKVHNNRFVIRSKPSVQVSWQVTGIRKDAWANAHRIQVVVPKTGSADGRYVHPELYGKPLSKSVVVLPGMTPGTKPKFSPRRMRTEK